MQSTHSRLASETGSPLAHLHHVARATDACPRPFDKQHNNAQLLDQAIYHSKHLHLHLHLAYATPRRNG